MLNLPLRELKEDIIFLRNFSSVNSNNEIGKKINNILDYCENKIKEENIINIPKPVSNTSKLSFNGVK